MIKISLYYRILRHFCESSDEYEVIFTSGCTGALKLLAETFQFIQDYKTECFSAENEKQQLKNDSSSINQKNDACGARNCNSEYSSHDNSSETFENSKYRPKFYYLQDNHTSVVGMRPIAIERGAEIICVDEVQTKLLLNGSKRILNDKSSKSDENKVTKSDERNENESIDRKINIGCHGDSNVRCICNSLFVYPAQSNFSGYKYPLSWIETVKSGTISLDETLSEKVYVCIDAASFVSTNLLDLSKFKPDFVTISFYKMFGYPTGLGNCCFYPISEGLF